MEFQQEQLQKWETYKNIAHLLSLPTTSLFFATVAPLFYLYYKKLALTQDLIISIVCAISAIATLLFSHLYSCQYTKRRSILILCCMMTLGYSSYHSTETLYNIDARNGTVLEKKTYRNSTQAIVAYNNEKISLFMQKNSKTKVGDIVTIEKVVPLTVENSFERMLLRQGVTKKGYRKRSYKKKKKIIKKKYEN